VSGQVLICGPPSGSFSARWRVLDDLTTRLQREPEAAAMLVRQSLDSTVAVLLAHLPVLAQICSDTTPHLGTLPAPTALGWQP
jgi:hypothetical protein